MAAINRPLPAHSEPDGRNSNFRSNSGVSSSAQQDLGPHSTAQDPGFPQHPIFARPFFYIPAPPPPPLVHYQWPMPFSYNPFSGFPSMGYGMIAPPPPFPPSPYMEAPGYILPHVHPVDYRRLHHPQTHTQGASHQNPTQTRRIRLNHFIPVREMVNSEVQTEPAQRGLRGYDLSSDSGRGSRSNSPCSRKQTLTEVVDCKSPCREETDSRVKEPCTSTTFKTGFPKHPVGSNAVESCGSTRQDTPMNSDQEPIPDSLSKDGNCNLWLRSPDGVLPLSSSSQKADVVLKERRISVPDILMNWGGGTPQPVLLKTTDVELSHTNNQPSYQHEVEHNKPLSHSSTEINTGITEGLACPKVSEMLFRVLRLPYSTIDTFLESNTHEEPVEVSFSERHSFTFRDEMQYLQNSSHNNSTTEVQENDNGTYLYEISDVAPHIMSASSCQANTKSNESIWSVESLPAYIPTRKWVLQMDMLGPKVNEEMEEVGNVVLSNQNDNLMLNKEKTGRSFSSCLSVQVSESGLCCSIQEEEQSPLRETITEMKADVSEPMDPEQSQSLLHSENNVLSPFSALPGKAASTPTENRSSEPEAGQSPNQNPLITDELRQKSLSSSEEMSLNSAAEEVSSSAVQLISQTVVDIEDNEVPIMVHEMAEVSPSKGTLVDFGVQCNEFHEQLCLCGELMKSTETNRRHRFKSSDMKKPNDGRNGLMQRRKTGQWRGTGQERQFSQQEAHSGYCRGGKSKGGRNPRY